jgi:hypothetical protein
MVSRVQNIRSTNKNTRPPNTTRQPGEFYVNFADKQLGVIDPAQVPQDLIAIRFFSADTDYVTGDHVIQQGRAYRARAAIPAGPFDPAEWETAGMADVPPDSRLYGRVNGAWEIPEIGDVANLQQELALKAPLASPNLSGVPTAPTAAPTTNNVQLATTAFVKSQNYAAIGGDELNARVAKAGDTMTGPLTLNATPTVPLHAATKGYVDAKPSGASMGDIGPTSPVNGQMWWESDTGALYVYYDDGNSQAWVQLNASVIDAYAKAETYTKAESDAKFVDTAGDTMTGSLTIQKAINASFNLNTTDPTSYSVLYFMEGAALKGSIQLIGSTFVAQPSRRNDLELMTMDGDIVINPRNTALTSTIFTANGGVGFSADPGIAVGWGNTTPGMVYAGNTLYISRPAGAAPVLSLNTVGPATVVSINHNGGAVGSITITTNSTGFNTSSSAELKEDLQSFDAGNIIDDTEVYDFKWKDTTERAYGIVAQQAVEVYPQAVTHDEEQDWWGVDYSKYVPVILQELKALRARVAELEGDKAPIAPKKRS